MRQVKINNAVAGSGVVLVKKWVKMKYVPTQDELEQVAAQNSEKKDALEIAQSIVQEQMEEEERN